MKTGDMATLVCMTSALSVVGATAKPTKTVRVPAYTLPMAVSFTAPDICNITVASQTFSLPEDQNGMVAALRKLRRTWRSLSILGGVETPYRCIGVAIYLSQRGGFRKVGFIAEPPER